MDAGVSIIVNIYQHVLDIRRQAFSAMEDNVQIVETVIELQLENWTGESVAPAPLIVPLEVRTGMYTPIFTETQAPMCAICFIDFSAFKALICVGVVATLACYVLIVVYILG